MDNLQLKHYIIEALKIHGVGWHAVDRIIGNGLYMQEQWIEELLESLGFTKAISSKLCHFHNQYRYPSLDELLDREQNSKYVSIAFWEERYPEALKQIAQPPWILFAVGRLELLTNQSIAIVGTRYPSNYGKQCSRQFANEFANSGITIVSGLANGVDTIAHKEAVQYTASTIAVLPSAIGHCYPTNNYNLYHQLSSDGLLLSETVQYQPVHPGQFHARNRIIAGLSSATVVVEGERKSGSMITARHALDMDRELFAVPGSIYSKKSEGPNFLIEKGYARMLLTSHQLFEELPWLKPQLVEGELASSEQSKNINLLSQDELTIYLYIKEQPRSINEIVEFTSIPFGHLSVLLLNLCIKQLIELQPGSIYIAL